MKAIDIRTGETYKTKHGEIKVFEMLASSTVAIGQPCFPHAVDFMNIDEFAEMVIE